MDEELMRKLSEHAVFDRWGVYDDKLTIVRLATSWSTTEDDLRVLRELC
jgi:threonine aldolase